MLEPLGVSHNCVERLDVEGEDVLVIGCGAIGLLVQNVARAMGAKRSVYQSDFLGERGVVVVNDD